jgi:uncharacterized protein (TIGR02118 family)
VQVLFNRVEAFGFHDLDSAVIRKNRALYRLAPANAHRCDRAGTGLDRQDRRPFQASSEVREMIKVSVMYKNSDGCRFDMDYYCKSHVPMVKDKLGAACQGIAVDEGIAGGEPGSKPPYVAMIHLYFESAEAFQNSFGPQAETILADVPNYTDAEMVIQMSQVLINASRSESGELHLHCV